MLRDLFKYCFSRLGFMTAIFPIYPATMLASNMCPRLSWDKLSNHSQDYPTSEQSEPRQTSRVEI